MQGIRRFPLARASAAAILSISALALTACASQNARETGERKHPKEYFSEAKYGVKASPRVSLLKRNLPRGGGRDQTGKPYMVKGKWYYPKEDKSYRKVGGASWYGDAFHGRLTANGEIYDMTHLTAAHPTMPLPSYARVTNMANGTSLIVRVNDRGPYEKGRIIDLSHRAAELLDYANAGMASVKVEYIGRAPLDGRDDKFLLASYRPGNAAPDPSDGLPSGVMIAMNGSQPAGGGEASSAPFLRAPAPIAAFDTASVGSIALPSTGPIAPQRPEIGAGQQVAFASMSYAAGEPARGARGLAAFDAASQGAAAYVLAGTFANRAEADALALRLQPFGAATVRKEGKHAYSVTLRDSEDLSGDALLEAAWANGAADAMTVRD